MKVEHTSEIGRLERVRGSRRWTQRKREAEEGIGRKITSLDKREDPRQRKEHAIVHKKHRYDNKTVAIATSYACMSFCLQLCYYEYKCIYICIYL